MANIGFIGVGNMGGPMTRNLVRAGHAVKAFDLSDEAMNFAVQSGASRASSAADAATDVNVLISMLPVGANVRQVYLEGGVLESAAPGTLMIDSSTIDVESARAVHAAAKAAGFDMLDARFRVASRGPMRARSLSCVAVTQRFSPKRDRS